MVDYREIFATKMPWLCIIKGTTKGGSLLENFAAIHSNFNTFLRYRCYTSNFRRLWLFARNLEHDP